MPDPTTAVNVSAAAKAALECLDGQGATPLQMAQEVAIQAASMEFLEALTGLKGTDAIDQAEVWATARPPITAHVAPF